ncbi:hypothetical protein S653_003475 [Salmonella enterica subsp. enterica]|nr:hypothetical protein [Salmonella enterica subsp. enterica]
MCGRSRIISTLARRVRASCGLPTDSHNHIEKAIWMAQGQNPHQRYPSASAIFSGRILGLSRSVFYIKANPAVSRKFSGRFPTVPRTALWPFLNFSAAAGGRKEKGRFQPLPSYLPVRM